MSPGRAPGRALLALLLALPAWGGAVADLSPADYLQRLQALQDARDRGDEPATGAALRALAGRHVAWRSGSLPVDGTVQAEGRLLPAVTHRHLQARIDRVAALVAAEAGAGAAAGEPQPAALAELRRQQALADRVLALGGRLESPTLDPEALPPSWRDRLAELWDWIRERLRDLWRWLWPRDEGHGDHAGASGAVVPLTLAGVGLLAVGALVLVLLLRRGRRTAGPATPDPAVADDHDPTSRPAAAWRLHARRLEQEGRLREAVRAWYHALLVTCWSRGVLHHRVGRTNWDYALALRPDLPWRPGFVDLTGRFDRAWYGAQPDGTFGADAEHLLGLLETEPAPAPAPAAPAPAAGAPPAPSPGPAP